MARTRWPPGPVNPGLWHRPGRSDRQRRWVPRTGPGRQIVRKTTRAASADSEVRPDPAPDPTPTSPRNLGSRAGALTHILPADYSSWMSPAGLCAAGAHIIHIYGWSVVGQFA